MRQALTVLHRWLGLAAAGFLIISGLTGAVISWDHELDGLLNPHLTEAVAEGPALPSLALAWLLATAAIMAAGPAVAATGTPAAGERQDRPRRPQPDAPRARSGSQQVAQAATQPFDIPPQPLSQALIRFGRETGLELFFDAAIVRGVASPGARGSLTREQALDRLLAGTGLIYRFANASTVTLAKVVEGGDGATVLDPIAVESAAARFGDLPEAPGFKADFQASATKMPLSIRETPQAVSVTTRDSIERRQGATSTPPWS